MFRRLATDAAHRLALDLAPLGEVRQRPAAPPPAPPLAAATCPAPPKLLITRLANSLTSSSEMRPPGPLPLTCVTSTPISRASLRTEGAAGADVTAAAGAEGADAADCRAAAKATTGALGRSGSGAGGGSAGGSGWSRRRGGRGGRRRRGRSGLGRFGLGWRARRPLIDDGDGLARLHLVPGLDADFLDHARDVDGTSTVALSVSSSRTG